MFGMGKYLVTLAPPLSGFPSFFAFSFCFASCSQGCSFSLVSSSSSAGQSLDPAFWCDTTHSLFILSAESASPEGQHNLMRSNRKVYQVKFLPNPNTVASYCFLALHRTLQDSPSLSWSSSGEIMRFTWSVQTVWSTSKWRSAWVGSGSIWFKQSRKQLKSHLIVYLATNMLTEGESATNMWLGNLSNYIVDSGC